MLCLTESSPARLTSLGAYESINGLSPIFFRVRCSALFADLFIMGPHPNNLYSLKILENLIDETVLYVDSSRIGAGKVTHEFLERGRILVRVFSKDV
jgi:hypothetical protein